MQRRTFLQMAAAAPGALGHLKGADIPAYRVVTRFPRSASPGMPGPYPGLVASVRSAKSMDAFGKADFDVVAEMISRGMRSLTGEKDVRDAWRRFVSRDDVVGIKVNCSGAPKIMSHPAVVSAICRSLIAAGVPPGRIYIYERFPDQVESVGYPRFIPEGVRIHTVESPRNSILNYDPRTYVDVNFGGEEDTRSMMVRLVTETLTKIIDVPNMKDHSASGVTGCLKNIAYGDFSNVARSHIREKSNTLSFIGTLADVEPLRSKTVLHIMDGLKGVWHGGPFAPDDRYAFYPKRILVGTDPVAMDRLLIDIIDDKRKQEGAISVWDRDPKYLAKSNRQSPNANLFFREPGHIEYAAGLGLGVYELGRIRVKEEVL